MYFYTISKSLIQLIINFFGDINSESDGAALHSLSRISSAGRVTIDVQNPKEIDMKIMKFGTSDFMT